MCRHFSIEAPELGELKVYPGITLHLKTNPYEITLGKLAPGLALNQNQEVVLLPLSFGFPSFTGKLIYNARSETVEEKPMFQDSFSSRRAVFPCTAFWEVDKRGEEHEFRFQEKIGYLAGIYKKDRFVLLTEKPKDLDLLFLHPRMPFLIRREDLLFYLSPQIKREDLLSWKKPELLYQRPKRQLSLF